MTIKCQSCPMIQYCIARLTDRTITGCGMSLYEAGLIQKADIVVEHTVREEQHATLRIERLHRV